MRVVDIRSRDAEFQRFETLKRNREKRQKSKLFFVEGVRNINGAVNHGWEIEAFAYERGAALSGWARGLLGSDIARTGFALSAELMGELSGKEDPSELIALVKLPPDTGELPTLRDAACVVVFDRPSNKGNLGTMIRSCEALGADALVVTGHAVDLYDPETIAASMGSFFCLPTLRLPGGAPLEEWLLRQKQALGARIVGTSAHASANVYEHDFTQPTLLLIGNEADGLSRALAAVSDAMVKIPFAEGSYATSLNVACATSVLLYEIDRQRRTL